MKHIAIIGFVLCTWLLSGCDTPGDFRLQGRYFLKYFGGEGSQEGVDVVVDANGNFYLLGTSTLDPVQNINKIYVAKADPLGNLISEVVLFEGTSDRYLARDLELTSNNQLAIVADQIVANNNRDIVVLLLDLNLNVVQQRTIGLFSGATPTDEEATGISETNDGFVITGSTTRTIGLPNTRNWLQLRLQPDLSDYSPTWRNSFGPGEGSFHRAVRMWQVGAEFRLFTYNEEPNSGRLLFQARRFQNDGESGGTTEEYGVALRDQYLQSVSIHSPRAPQAFLMAGVSVSNGVGFLYTVRVPFNIEGNAEAFLSSIRLSEQMDLSRRSVYVAPAQDPGYVLIANFQGTDGQPGENDILVMRLDDLGRPIGSGGEAIRLGGRGNDTIGSVMELPDRSIVVVGTMTVGGNQTKICLFKLNPDGKLIE